MTMFYTEFSHLMKTKLTHFSDHYEKNMENINTVDLKFKC